MTRSFGPVEKQSLLRNKGNVQEPQYLSPYFSGARSDQLFSSSELDTTSSIGVFKSRSVIAKPDENYYIEGLPIWRAVLLVVNAALGAGILNFPQAFAECGGVLNGLVIELVGHLFAPRGAKNVFSVCLYVTLQTNLIRRILFDS